MAGNLTSNVCFEACGTKIMTEEIDRVRRAGALYSAPVMTRASASVTVVYAAHQCDEIMKKQKAALGLKSSKMLDVALER